MPTELEPNAAEREMTTRLQMERCVGCSTDYREELCPECEDESKDIARALASRREACALALAARCATDTEAEQAANILRTMED